jgi:two-component system OmpR family sensor kinase
VPIRVRLALSFGAAAAVLLALGGWLFVSVLSSSMLGSVDAQLATAARVASHYVTAGGGENSNSPAGALPGEYLLQVIGATGSVTAAGTDAGRTPLIPRSTVARAAAGPVTETEVGDEGATRILAEPYPGHQGSVVVVARSLETYDKSMRTIELGVVLAGVAVLVVAVAGSYLLARRALTPVERMRRQVQALSATDDTMGIGVPPTRDELATLARTMNDLLARLQASLARQRSFVADASHELRSPLAVLRGELELAGKSGRTREELAEAVASAAEEVTRLTQLVEELLLLARSDSAGLALRIERTDVAALLMHVRQANRRRAKDAGLELVVSAPDDLHAALDAHRLRQALDNLVDNALRFAPRGTSIELRASADGNMLVIEVLDRGPGFPDEFLPRAFERFSRPSGERGRADGGAGLGLAIVEAVATAHGGRAVARNRAGGGACIRVELPADPTRSAAHLVHLDADAQAM